jgi:hypothetical protein
MKGTERETCAGCADSKCTCNVIFQYVLLTIVTVEVQYVLHYLSVCACILTYSASKAHSPCYVFVCGPSVCTVFFHVTSLTLNPPTWKIWWAPNNVSKGQMGFNSVFKGLKGWFSGEKCFFVSFSAQCSFHTFIVSRTIPPDIARHCQTLTHVFM